VGVVQTFTLVKTAALATDLGISQDDMTLGLKVHEEFEECNKVQEVLEERNITAHFEDSAALVCKVVNARN
jgi:hypothetical protein